ncbi:class I adenylate-forming enzyme family protein, partial [Bordetella petrii]|uniref:class I adenylate-forming enzyme family protein n=1 Tax=Bordetella petrii TaxID=94624 RepID=UPI001E34A292
RGVRRGARVAVVGETCPEMIQALFACSLLGAWPVGLNARLSRREVGVILDHARPALTLYTSRVSPAAAGHAQEAGASETDAGTWGAGNHHALAGRPATAETGHLAGQVATVIYTSGTTGAPKGVMVPHRGLLHFARISAASRRLVPGDIGYAALPLSHIFGIATVLMATVHAGASLVLRSRYDPQDVLRALQSPGISILQGVPTMFTRLLAAAPAQPPAAPRLRYVYTGGAALDPTLKRDTERYFGLPLHHGYGITEYAGSLFVTDIDSPRADCATGQAVEGVELRLGSPDAGPPRPGERGDILVRGPGVMLGYYRNPAQTAQALLEGGWLNTGDIGHVDEQGALFIAGRSKDLIIRSGFNVYPAEVEAVINAFPGVRLSAVVGRLEADQNEEVVAFIEAQPGTTVDADALMTHLRGQLAPYKRPARIVPIDALPTTVSGKILKQPLRERLA